MTTEKRQRTRRPVQQQGLSIEEWRKFPVVAYRTIDGRQVAVRCNVSLPKAAAGILLDLEQRNPFKAPTAPATSAE